MCNEKSRNLDNLAKYKCFACGKTFIVGVQQLKDEGKESPYCCYCGNGITMKIACTTEDTLKEMNLGDIALYTGSDTIVPDERRRVLYENWTDESNLPGDQDWRKRLTAEETELVRLWDEKFPHK